MGYYIQTPEHTHKAEQIVRIHGGKIVPTPQSFDEIPADKALIVVIQNMLFDAAGLVYSKEEFQAFLQSPGNNIRPYICVLLDKALAHKLSGYSQS